MDGSVARYVHLVADLINMVDWKEVKDFVGFVEALYPFMPVIIAITALNLQTSLELKFLTIEMGASVCDITRGT